MQEWGVKPEIEAFDPGMIANAAYYLKKGILKAPPPLPVLHGLRQRYPRQHEEPGLYEGDDGVPVPRLHLELLRGGPFPPMEMLYGAVAMGGHIRWGWRTT